MDISQNAAGLYEVTIDGKLYEFAKWGAEKSLTTLPDLVSIVQPVLDKIAEAVDAGDNVPVLSFMPCAIRGLTQNRAQIIPMCKALTVGSVCDHKLLRPEDFDRHFSDLFHLAQVLAAAIEVQYGSFFGRVRSFLNTLSTPKDAIAS